MVKPDVPKRINLKWIRTRWKRLRQWSEFRLDTQLGDRSKLTIPLLYSVKAWADPTGQLWAVPMSNLT